MSERLYPPDFVAPELKDLPLREVERVLRSFRNKNSYWFMLKWSTWKRPKLDPEKMDLPFFLNLFNVWEKEAEELYAMYIGLLPELGMMKSLSAVTALYDRFKSYNERLTEDARIDFLVKKYGENIPRRYHLSKDERSEDFKKLRRRRRRLRKVREGRQKRDAK